MSDLASVKVGNNVYRLKAAFDVPSIIHSMCSQSFNFHTSAFQANRPLKYIYDLKYLKLVK